MSWTDDQYLDGKREACQALLEIYRRFLAPKVYFWDLHDAIKEAMTQSPGRTRTESEQNGWEKVFTCHLDCLAQFDEENIETLPLLRMIRQSSCQLRGITQELVGALDQLIQRLEKQ